MLAPEDARACVRLVRQPEGGEHDTREAGAEFLQRPSARDGLGQALGQFIEFIIHNFPFGFEFLVLS